MTNKTESNSGFQQLFTDVKEYIDLQSAYLQINFVEKLTKLLSKLLIGILVLIFVMAGFFYLLFALAYALAPLIGIVGSFAVIGGLYFGAIAIIIVFRKKLIINPLLKLLIDVFYEKSDKKNDKVENEGNT